MTVFKTFLKILNSNKSIIIMYTAMLILFGGINMSSNENSIGYIESKPKVYIKNNDINEGITKDFINYMKKISKMPKISDNAIDDALFYQDIDYVIYIPKDFNQDFIDGKNPELDIKKSTSASSSYADMLVKKYMKTANIYRLEFESIDEILKNTNDTLDKKIDVNITTKLDTNALARSTFYFNFESYSILACLIYVISLILSSFNLEKIRKRTIISSTNYKKTNRILLFSNYLLAIVMWLAYLIMSYFLIGDVMLSNHGILYAINSLVFSLCATTLAVLIGNLVTKKDAINGIVNVIAIGSSFLCGAFVPVMWLPKSVLTAAHIFPTYYYINNNEAVASIETFNFDSLKPLIINIGIMVIFSIVFIILTNIVAKKRRKIG